jgi:hypothetical protein
MLQLQDFVMLNCAQESYITFEFHSKTVKEH